MSNEIRKVLEQMPAEKLNNLILQLGRYAVKVSSEYRNYWRTRNYYELPRGETYDSIVSKALTLALEGKRQWDPREQPDILNFFRDAIDSLFYHLARHSDNKLLEWASEGDGAEKSDLHTGSPKRDPVTDWLTHQQPSPEGVLLQKEISANEDDAIRLLLELSSNDQILLQVITAMLKGCNKPGEIASATGIVVEKVYLAIKRLDRKILLVKQLMTESASQSQASQAVKQYSRRRT